MGLLIIPADAVRLLAKELIIPEGVDRPAWDIWDLLIMAFSAVRRVPDHPDGQRNIQIADPEVGLALVFALASIASVGW